MTDQNRTDIIAIIDRSGSMASIAKDMQGGYNQFIKDQAALPGICKVTLYQFDALFEEVYSDTDASVAPDFVLSPRGSTALLDAMGYAITQVGERFSAMPEDERPSKVIVVVVTDGAENASKEYKRDSIMSMVKTQEESYGWQFVFLGANQDAIAAGAGIGVSVANSMTYAATSRGVANTYSSLTANVGAYRGGTKASVTFTDEDRSNAIS